MRRVTWFVLGFLLICTGTSQAQVLTGNIIGTVKDESAAVLPGVTVTLTSPALPAGPAVAVTNQSGEYRFTLLNPGVYTLNVALGGFGTYEETGLRVVVSGTIERNVTLKLATVAESITVAGQSPMVDPQKVGVTANVTQEVIEELPARRQSVASYMKWAGPGVAPTDPSGYTANVSVMGSGTNENSILYNGIMSNSPSGGYWLQGDVDAVEEVQVNTLGASAEYQVAQGAVFNMITKSGTNKWKFDAQGHIYPSGLQSQPIKLSCNCSEGTTGYNIISLKEYSGHAGGPIVKDKLWFYGGGMWSHRQESNPGVDPTLPRTQIENTAIGKVTWQVNNKIKLSQMLENEWFAFPNLPSVAMPFETVTNLYSNRLYVYASEMTATLSSSTLITARATGWLDPEDNVQPLSGDTTTSFRLNSTSGIACCGVRSFGYNHSGRHGQSAKISHFINGARIDHNLQAGVQFERAYADAETATPGGVTYSDLGTTPDQATFSPPSVSGASFRSQGIWAEDQMRIGDRLTVSVGFRLDRMEGIGQDLPAIDNLAHYTGATITGLGSLFSWIAPAPRAGFNYKLTRDGKTALRGSVGRAFRAISTGDFTNLSPGIQPTTLTRYNPASGKYDTIISVTDPKANITLDRDLKAPFTDMFSIGVDRELMPNLGVGVTYVHKHGQNQIGWTDIGGTYAPFTAVLPDGSTLQAQQLTSATSTRRFMTTNGPGLFNKYDGLVMAIDKRMSHRWMLNMSYTYSRAYGLVTSGTAGQDPNDIINAAGRLSTDRPHIFLGGASYEVPVIGVQIAANLQALSGTPFAPQAQVSLNQGRRNISIAPPGDYRVPSQELLYLRFNKIFRYGDRRLELATEIANVLQNEAYLTAATQNFFASNFGQSSGNYIQPRRMTFIVKTYF